VDVPGEFAILLGGAEEDVAIANVEFARGGLGGAQLIRLESLDAPQLKACGRKKEELGVGGKRSEGDWVVDFRDILVSISRIPCR